MATDVVMPQMGESIAEGTIVRWIKKVGDTVDRDEPLFEISTDKVDAEIPSPAAGVVSEIRVKEGETVPVNSVVAVIGAMPVRRRAAAGGCAPAKAVDPPKAAPQADGSPPPAAAAPTDASRRRPTRVDAGGPVAEPSKPSPRPAVRAAKPDRPRREHVGADQRRRRARPPKKRSAQRSSPLVRKIAKEHNVDISQIHGTGIAGRVTKDDILGFIGQEGGKAGRQEGQDGQEGRQGRKGRKGRQGRALLRQAHQFRRRRSSSRRLRSCREDVADAEAHRRAHGAEPPHVGARALGLRGELLARREDSRGEEGRVRARRREAHLSVVHHQGGRRRAARRARSSTRRSTATTSSITRTSTSASPSRSTGA